MKILLIGSGGREHALAWRLRQDDPQLQLFTAPGNAGTEVHANGANMDNLEVHDERRILASSCFSIEPGVYLPEFGIRSEVNMLVRSKGAEVTGRMQNEIVII